MSTKQKIKEVLKFLAGFQTAHLLSHILLQFSGKLPQALLGFTVTETLNFWAIIVNAIVWIVLIYLAY